MRHYEIVFLVHPDQSDQTQAVLNKFTSLVEGSGGKVHRSEDIGSRKLAYPILDQYKASYALLNIECNQEVIDEISTSFKFNDAIIRDLILSKNKEYTEASALSKQTKEDEDKKVDSEASISDDKNLNKEAKVKSQDKNSKKSEEPEIIEKKEGS